MNSHLRLLILGCRILVRNRETSRGGNIPKVLRILLASTALVVSAASFAKADSVTVVTTSTGFVSNDSVDWSQLGVNNFNLASGSTATSTNRLTTTITFGTGGPGSTLQQCPATSCTWSGNFAPGDNLLTDLNFSTGGSSGDILLSFNQGISAVGFQMEPNVGGPITFTAVIQVYVSGVLAHTFDEPGTEEAHMENNSAGFYGVEDLSGANITAIDLMTINCGGSGVDCGGLALNQLRLEDSAVATPEPGTLALFGSGLLLLGFLRRRFPASC